MGRAVEALILFWGLAALSTVAVMSIRARVRRNRGLWEVKDRVEAGHLVIFLRKPGEGPWDIGSVAADDPNRGYRIAELRAEAEECCAEVNAGRRRLPR